MQSFRYLYRAPYTCASCTQRIATAAPRLTRSYASQRRPRSDVTDNNLRPQSSTRALNSKHSSQAQPTELPKYVYSATYRRPLRVCIIGAGPAGFFTAQRLLRLVPDAVVDMYEQLPVPYGLIRYGVAPDHPEVRSVEAQFDEVAESPRFNFIGNIRIGHHVELIRVQGYYDAMVFAYGASKDKPLGIPGEKRRGVYSAREFVGWYNGLPEFQNLQPDLYSGDQAVIIGQGNVALDVARILLTPVDLLRKTDITEQALEALSRNKIKSVKIVGRRGPLQASFTTREARELMHIPDIAFEPIDRSFYPPDIKKLPRQQKRAAEVLLKGTQTTPVESPKSWALDFLKAPKSMDASGASDHLTSVTFTDQVFALNADPLSKSASVVPTSQTTVIPASLAFRSVGYKSQWMAVLDEVDVPWDEERGIIPTDLHGRVTSYSGSGEEEEKRHVPGMYCSGWVKSGPTGVIADTRADAYITAEAIAHDWESGAQFMNFEHGKNLGLGTGWDGLKEELIRDHARPTSWADWKKIDEAERARGKELGKEREKFVSIEDMLKFLDEA